MMSKQELIRRLKEAITEPALNDYQRVENIALTYALGLVEELEKPVVPQFVADWYEEHKDNFEDGVYDLFVKFYEYEYRRNLSTDLLEWFDSDDNKPIETLVKMKLFGYEVEKEKLYTAKLKLTNEYLVYESQFDDLLHYKVPDSSAKEVKAYHFTEDDLVNYNIWGNNYYEVEEVK